MFFKAFINLKKCITLNSSKLRLYQNWQNAYYSYLLSNEENHFNKSSIFFQYNKPVEVLSSFIIFDKITLDILLMFALLDKLIFILYLLENRPYEL